MKMILPIIAVLISGFAFAQCDISTFIQENYEFDAKVLALREIQNNPLDPDYNNLFLPEARITPFLEKLSAIYENPDNEPVIDSFFNELQIHVNPGYYNYVYYKQMTFSIDNAIPWLDDFINSGVSGNSILDNLMSEFQFTIVNAIPFSQSTAFRIESSYELLNMVALVDDFEMVLELEYILPGTGPASGYNYTGIPYIVGPFDTYAVVCDIVVTDDVYRFSLHGGDCPAGCAYTISWDVIVSENCEVTLSTSENEIAQFSVYPNPVSEILFVKNLNSESYSFKIYTLLGQVVKLINYSSEEISVADLKAGIYFIEITTSEGNRQVQKFIKQ